MTDFQKWYTMITPEKIFAGKTLLRKLQQAYEAGAASQAGTLRDEFAGQALLAIPHIGNGSELQPYELAHDAYKMADAMLKARKPPEEDQGSRSDTNVLTVEITFDPTQCVEGAAAYDPEVDLQSVMEFGAEHYNMTDWKVL
jgi:hypothetical protein